MAGLVLIVPLFVPYAEMVAKSWRVGQITFLKDHEIDYPYPIADPKRPEQTAKRIAAKIEDNSIIFADWGILWAIAYVTHVEQSRTGIQPVELTPFGSDGQFPKTALGYIAENIETRPIYINRPEDALRRIYSLTLVDPMTNLYRVKQR
jgi:hypothetical protein